MSKPPILVRFENGVFAPATNTAALRASAHYVPGKDYLLTEFEERSLRSHNHLFAALDEAFHNLPEEMAANFVNREHFRKYIEIKVGHCTPETFVFDTPQDATRTAQFMRMLKEFSVVDVVGNVVTRYVAKSISKRELGKDAFQKLKTDMLETAAAMVGVTAATLEKNAGRAA